MQVKRFNLKITTYVSIAKTVLQMFYNSFYTTPGRNCTIRVEKSYNATFATRTCSFIFVEPFSLCLSSRETSFQANEFFHLATSSVKPGFICSGLLKCVNSKRAFVVPCSKYYLICLTTRYQ